MITIPYNDLTKVLAEYNGTLNEYFNLKKNAYFKSFEDRKQAQRDFATSLHVTNPNIFGSDIHIEDYYKLEFIKKYGSNVGGYKKMCYDIETDGMSDPNTARYPINCMSSYDFDSDTMYTFVLDDPVTHPTVGIFKEKLQSGEFEQLLRDDSEMNGGYEYDLNGVYPEWSNKHTQYVIKVFDSEYDMIVARYELLHTIIPDICTAWNFTFDELTTINRLKFHIDTTKKSTSVEDIICDPAVPPEYKQWYYSEDINPRYDWHNKWHTLNIPGRTTYMCAMSAYSNLRKSTGKFNSYGLNNTCIRELGKGKLDYHDIATNPVELAIKDFTLHVQYNIRDVWLMAELERKNNDIDSIMGMGETVRLSQINRVTARIKNYQQLSYEKQGLVIGNNINVANAGDGESYDGAIIADPDLNEAIVTPVYNYPSKTIRPYVIDNDLTSQYPSSIIAHNIYKTTLLFQMTQVGTIGIPHPTVGMVDIGECMDNYQCNDVITWGHQYLDLPSLVDLVTGIDSELKSIKL
jgi:DNA polymerase elongation subunit (family B)